MIGAPLRREKLPEQVHPRGDRLGPIHGDRAPNRAALRHWRRHRRACWWVGAVKQVPGPATLEQVVDHHRFLAVQRPLEQRLEHGRQLLETVRPSGQGEAVPIPAAVRVPENDHAAGRLQHLQGAPEQQVGRHLADMARLHDRARLGHLRRQAIHSWVLPPAIKPNWRSRGWQA
jgi:hypothetical protein